MTKDNYKYTPQPKRAGFGETQKQTEEGRRKSLDRKNKENEELKFQSPIVPLSSRGRPESRGSSLNRSRSGSQVSQKSFNKTECMSTTSDTRSLKHEDIDSIEKMMRKLMKEQNTQIHQMIKTEVQKIVGDVIKENRELRQHRDAMKSEIADLKSLSQERDALKSENAVLKAVKKLSKKENQKTEQKITPKSSMNIKREADY